jgi:hypothetical protein
MTGVSGDFVDAFAQSPILLLPEFMDLSALDYPRS